MNPAETPIIDAGIELAFTIPAVIKPAYHERAVARVFAETKGYDSKDCLGQLENSSFLMGFHLIASLFQGLYTFDINYCFCIIDMVSIWTHLPSIVAVSPGLLFFFFLIIFWGRALCKIVHSRKYIISIAMGLFGHTQWPCGPGLLTAPAHLNSLQATALDIKVLVDRGLTVTVTICQINSETKYTKSSVDGGSGDLHP